MKPVKLSRRWEYEALIVLKWYTSLLTKSEIEAYRNLTLEGEASAAKSSKTSTLLRAIKSNNKEAIEESKDGFEAFLKKTFLRVVAEHGMELTRCPRCRLVCPPGAIVCDHCYLLLKK
jgi:ferredoxin